MGASSSKISRTLSKSSTTTTVRSPAAGSGSIGSGSSSAASAPSTSSRPHMLDSMGLSQSPSLPEYLHQQKYPVSVQTLQTANDIVETSRRASPLKRDETMGPVPGRNEGTSENKDAATLRDAFDPHFLTQLNRLGPIKVSGHGSGKVEPTEPPSQMIRILRARQEREQRVERERRTYQPQRSTTAAAAAAAAATASGSTFSASLEVNTLVMLLDERKVCKSREALSKLALQYDVDPTTLDVLTRRFNTPSVGAKLDTPEEEQFRREGQLDTPPRMLAVWTEPNWGASNGQPAKLLS